MEFITKPFLNQANDPELLGVYEEAEWLKTQLEPEQRMAFFPVEYKKWLILEINILRAKKFNLNNLLPQEPQRPLRNILQDHVQLQIDEHIKQLHILDISKKTKDQQEVDINAIKAIPIENFYVGKLRRTSNLLAGKCPFHEDKTASFMIYFKTNTWHCFGCQAGRDVIDFVMKQQNLDFKQTINYLKNEPNH